MNSGRPEWTFRQDKEENVFGEEKRQGHVSREGTTVCTQSHRFANDICTGILCYLRNVIK